MLIGRYRFASLTPFEEKKTTFIFVNTLPEPYYEKMIENAMRNFAEMVWSGELIEHGLKTKKSKRSPHPHHLQRKLLQQR